MDSRQSKRISAASVGSESNEEYILIQLGESNPTLTSTVSSMSTMGTGDYLCKSNSGGQYYPPQQQPQPQQFQHNHQPHIQRFSKHPKMTSLHQRRSKSPQNGGSSTMIEMATTPLIQTQSTESIEDAVANGHNGHNPVDGGNHNHGISVIGNDLTNANAVAALNESSESKHLSLTRGQMPRGVRTTRRLSACKEKMKEDGGAGVSGSEVVASAPNTSTSGTNIMVKRGPGERKNDSSTKAASCDAITACKDEFKHSALAVQVNINCTYL